MSAVRDSEDEDDGDGVETNFGGGLTAGHDDDDEGEGDTGVTGGGLKVSDIDAFWLQRSLSKFYPDAHLSQKYAEVGGAQVFPPTLPAAVPGPLPWSRPQPFPSLDGVTALLALLSVWPSAPLPLLPLCAVCSPGAPSLAEASRKSCRSCRFLTTVSVRTASLTSLGSTSSTS